MYASTSIKFSRFQKPKIMAYVVAKRHGVLEEVFDEEFLVWFFFFLDVLLNEASLVVIEMLKYELLFKRILTFLLLQHLLIFALLLDILRLFNFLIVPYSLLLNIF